MVLGFEGIEIDPLRRSGKPCVKGTRITVGDVLGWLATGMSFAEIIEDFPELSEDSIREVLAYAATREGRTVIIAA